MKKYLLPISILVFLPFGICNAQDCKFLDSLRSFQGVKFGENIKTSKMKIADDVSSHDFTAFIIERDMVKNNNDLYHITKFLNSTFENIFLMCNKKNEIYSFIFTKPLNKFDSLEISNRKMPYSFVSLFDELQSIFGDYTSEKITNDSIVGLFGIKFLYVWECKKTKIEYSIIYGAKAFNKIELSLVDIDRQRKAKLEEIK